MIPYLCVAGSIHNQESQQQIPVDGNFQYVKWLVDFNSCYPVDSSIGCVSKLTESSATRLEYENLPHGGRYEGGAFYICPSGVNPIYPIPHGFLQQSFSYYNIINTDFSFELDFILLPKISGTLRYGYHRIMCLVNLDSGISYTGHSVMINASDLGVRYYCFPDNKYIESSYSVTENEWHHIEMSRSGTTVRVFLDGNLIISHTQSISDTDGEIIPTIGQSDATLANNQTPHAIIDNIRFTLGASRHTANFTPEQIHGNSGNSDIYRSNRACVLSFDSNYSDSSEYVNSTTLGSGSSISNSVYYSGGGALLCSTSSGPALTVTPIDSNIFRMFDSENSYEVSLRLNSITHDSVIFENFAMSLYGDHPNYMRAWIDAYGMLNVSFAENNQDYVGVTTRSGYLTINTNYQLSINDWHNILICMSIDDIYIFVNGELVIKTSTHTTNTSSTTSNYWMTAPIYVSDPVFSIGGSSHDTAMTLDGYIDSFVVTKGVALHKDNYIL